tara:strand:+ start:1014 stop:2165 length:1152 start_codon:yes stop_codon:yes gene_type:complete
MSGTHRFGIVAGEKSGDILGGSLMSAMKSYFPNAEFVGVGGSEMISIGCESLCSIERLSVMGFIEPLRRLPELLFLKKKLQERFARERISAFIGIDSPDFNLRLAKNLRGKGLKTVHFVSPSVWAYRQGRVIDIKESIDLMLTLFPFEQEIYKKYHIQSECVGHPLADRLSLEGRGLSDRKNLDIPESETVIALMPGSRVDEVNRLGPIFLETAVESLQRYPHLKFLIPFSNSETQLLINSLMERMHILQGEQFRVINDSQKALGASNFVFTASGTATLEALFLRKPMVICYKLASISYFIASRMLKIPYIGLPNLLANDQIVPEYLQSAVTPEALLAELDKFMTGSNSFSNVLSKYEKIHKELRGGAAKKAAHAIHKLVFQS